MSGDTQWLINFLLGIVLAGISWWNKTMWSELKETRRRIHDQAGEVNKLQILVAGTYVTRQEMEKSMHIMTQTVMNRFDRMEDKLDSQLGDIYGELKNKVDKP